MGASPRIGSGVMFVASHADEISTAYHTSGGHSRERCLTFGTMKEFSAVQTDIRVHADLFPTLWTVDLLILFTVGTLARSLAHLAFEEKLDPALAIAILTFARSETGRAHHLVILTIPLEVGGPVIPADGLPLRIGGRFPRLGQVVTLNLEPLCNLFEIDYLRLLVRFDGLLPSNIILSHEGPRIGEIECLRPAQPLLKLERVFFLIGHIRTNPLEIY